MEPVFEGLGYKYREKYNNYVELLKERLTEKRFFHSLCVANEALRLAEKYGCDKEKAFLAGLLHDICKDVPAKEQLKFFEQFDIILGSVEKSAQKLWHAIAGATYIEKVLKLADDDIILAVRYHTTARAGMSLLEKVIYLADFTSMDRDYPGVDEMRIAVEKDLSVAMEEALIFTVEDLREKGNPIHQDTLDAYVDTFGKEA